MTASTRTRWDAVVVGGGFYGCSLALHFRRSKGLSVLVVEEAAELLQRASFTNQARVHNGYHYPRSLLTALRSRVNFPRFSREYADCIDESGEMYYAIGRRFSNVTAAQFRIFCERIGAPLKRPPLKVQRLFNPHFIEDVFEVRESTFDAVRLQRRLWSELLDAGVSVQVRTEVRRVGSDGRGLLVELSGPEGPIQVAAKQVFNCTYSRTNRLLIASGLRPIPLKHELTELALVEVPDLLQGGGVTVMCGPFFSVIPFPARGLHSLSHVRYTPHGAWQDGATMRYHDPYIVLSGAPRRSNVVHMLKDAARYLPALADCRYQGSLWEVKTVLPRSEVDDSRPILLKADCGLAGLTCVMGSKLDNVYDVLDALAPVLSPPPV